MAGARNARAIRKVQKRSITYGIRTEQMRLIRCLLYYFCTNRIFAFTTVRMGCYGPLILTNHNSTIARIGNIIKLDKETMMRIDRTNVRKKSDASSGIRTHGTPIFHDRCSAHWAPRQLQWRGVQICIKDTWVLNVAKCKSRMVFLAFSLFSNIYN